MENTLAFSLSCTECFFCFFTISLSNKFCYYQLRASEVMSFGVVVLFVSYSELLNSLQNKTNKKIIMLYKLHSKSHMSHFMF